MIDTFKIIEDYSNIIQKQKTDLRNKMNTIVNKWSDICFSKLVDTEILCEAILCDWHNCSRNENHLPKDDDVLKWAKWYVSFLEDEKKHKADGHNFNIFLFLRDEFEFVVQETMHSKLIKFLLDPTASHGQEKKFLIEFLKLLDVEKPEEGIWSVTAEQGRIDILLKRNKPSSAIIVENKSNWAEDKPNQLYRYWYQEIYNTTRETKKEFYERNRNKYQILYLSPNENKKYEEQSVTKPIDLTDNHLPKRVPIEIKTTYYNTFFQRWLENCKKQLPETNHRIREYITQYQSLCNNL
jgi:hypothetical protein